MNEQDYVVGEHYYLPFWILLNYLDPKPPNPFVRVKLVAFTSSPVIGGTPENPTPESIRSCAVEVSPSVLAEDVPLSHLLHKHELLEWGDRLAQWFTDFAKAETCKIYP
jgi:hypothetical protein